MYGFTGKYYNGMKVFIREEYEYYHKDMSELERLSELFNENFNNLYYGICEAKTRNPKLLYNRGDYNLDNELRCGQPLNEYLWEPYLDGYIHVITSEYIPYSIKPNRDSVPCWSKRIAPIYESTEIQVKREIKNMGLFTLLLTSLFK